MKQLTTITIVFLVIGCSNSNSIPQEEINLDDSTGEQMEDSGSNQEEPNEDITTILFSKIYYENIIDDELRARVEYKFEGNKVIELTGFSPDGSLSNRQTYQYNGSQLLEKRNYYDSNGNITSILTYNYDNENISSIEIVSGTDTVNYIYNYSDDLIEIERVEPSGSRSIWSKYYLNEAGFIYKSENGILAEMVIQDSLPFSKKIVFGDDIEEFEHTYLDSPLPIGPWKVFWSNFYGNMNNQILVQTAGIVSHEDTIDLSKYITFGGRRLQRKYEFNLLGLPIKIEKTFNPSFKSIWYIEYQD